MIHLKLINTLDGFSDTYLAVIQEFTPKAKGTRKKS